MTRSPHPTSRRADRQVSCDSKPPQRPSSPPKSMSARYRFQCALHWLYADSKRAPEAVLEQELRELQAIQRRFYIAMGYRVDD